MAARPCATLGGETDAFIALAPAQAKQPAERIRRELFAAKTMAAAAFGFALLSVVLLAVALPRLSGASVSASMRGAVGLNAVAEQDKVSGWHRTYLQAVVRKGSALDSDKVTELPVGALVFVSEAQGRRARIMKPVEGWVSLRTSEGIEVLRPDMTYTGDMDSTDLDKVFQSRKMQERNLRLQAASAKMTEMQRQLLEHMHKLKARGQELRRSSEKVGTQVRDNAPQIGQKIAQSASKVLEKTMKPHGAQDFLQHLTHDKDFKHIFQDR